MEQQHTDRLRIDKVTGFLCDIESTGLTYASRNGESELLLSGKTGPRIVELSFSLMFPAFFNNQTKADLYLCSTIALGNTSATEACDKANSIADPFIQNLPKLRITPNSDIRSSGLDAPVASSKHGITDVDIRTAAIIGMNLWETGDSW